MGRIGSMGRGLYLGLILFLAAMLLVSNGYWVWKQREQMRVVRVIDGDTFVIKSGERVRLLGLDAPEMGNCFAEESKQFLETLIVGKVVKLDRNDRDTWGRRLGMVHLGKLNINEALVEKGFARYDYFSDEKSPQMELLGKRAEEQKSGLFGESCDGKERCEILGNIDESSGKKFYHFPGCPTYSMVRIDTERGEKIFCSENEAKKAGFMMAPNCGK